MYTHPKILPGAACVATLFAIACPSGVANAGTGGAGPEATASTPAPPFDSLPPALARANGEIYGKVKSGRPRATKTEALKAVRSPAVVLAERTLSLRAGTVRLQLGCFRSSNGIVSIGSARFGARRLGRASFVCRDGFATAQVPLSRRVQRFARQAKRVRVVVRIVAQDASGASTTRTVNSTLTTGDKPRPGNAHRKNAASIAAVGTLNYDWYTGRALCSQAGMVIDSAQAYSLSNTTGMSMNTRNWLFDWRSGQWQSVYQTPWWGWQYRTALNSTAFAPMSQPVTIGLGNRYYRWFQQVAWYGIGQSAWVEVRGYKNESTGQYQSNCWYF